MNYFADTVTSFSIFDTSNKGITVAHFSNGYPHIGQRNDKTYYLVLTAGDAAHLLKYISKKRQNIYEYNGPMKTQYTFTEDLEVFDVKNNSIRSIKKNIASIEKAMPEYTKVIEQALKDKNCQKPD